MKVELGEVFDEFNFDEADNKQVELIKDYYLKRKYLDRIESNLEN